MGLENLEFNNVTHWAAQLTQMRNESYLVITVANLDKTFWPRPKVVS